VPMHGAPSGLTNQAGQNNAGTAIVATPLTAPAAVNGPSPTVIYAAIGLLLLVALVG
jgi:hypothetical protein